jgi:hypothetical protein
MKAVVHGAPCDFAAAPVSNPEPVPGEVLLWVEMARAYATGPHRYPGSSLPADDYTGALNLLQDYPACRKALAP